ncbi:MAG: Cupin 2 conserved barrel domain protein [Dehalococcoidia bacterium]|nr:Cupin 2 conserved barrel domain protein [Dehalococcoidia bacterium]
MATELPLIRRIVTGFDASGASVFIEDGVAPCKINPTRPAHRSWPVWATGKLPVPVNDPDHGGEVHGIMPPPGGSVLKIVDIAPEPKDSIERERALAAERVRVGAHPGMHETDSIDYAIVLSGEVYAIMEKGEKLMKTGDVLIQRGTNHAWSNRSDAYCRIAFVLVEATR